MAAPVKMSLGRATYAWPRQPTLGRAIRKMTATTWKRRFTAILLMKWRSAHKRFYPKKPASSLFAGRNRLWPSWINKYKGRAWPDRAATPPGDLTAHGKFRLVLLCSQPDTVRRFPLRKTEFHHCRQIRQCTALLVYLFSRDLSRVSDKITQGICFFFGTIPFPKVDEKVFQHLAAFILKDAAVNRTLMIKLRHFQEI